MEIRRAVAEHQADFGFTSSPFDDLDNHVVLKDHIIAISSEEDTEPVSLWDTTEPYILCHAAQETILEKLKGQKISLSHFFNVQEAETVIHLVSQKNGIGIISEFTLDATPNSLKKLSLIPPVEIEIGLIATDLNDLTPVASALAGMIKEECSEYTLRHKNSAACQK